MSDAAHRPPLASTLAEMPIFAGLPADDLVAVVGVVREQDARAGQTLLAQGNPGHEMFLVLEGLVEVWRDDEVVEVLGRGAVVGEVAVFTGGLRNASVIARTDVHLGVIGEAALHSLIDTMPALADRLRSVVRIRSAR